MICYHFYFKEYRSNISGGISRLESLKEILADNFDKSDREICGIAMSQMSLRGTADEYEWIIICRVGGKLLLIENSNVTSYE